MIGSAALLLSLVSVSYSKTDHVTDRDLLTRGVTNLIAPGCLPGPLDASGDAFVVLAASQGKARVPLFVATDVEKGRAIAGGHEGFFSKEAMQNPSNERFLENSLEWLSRKPLAGLHVGLVGMPDLYDVLVKAGAIPNNLGGKSFQAGTATNDVLCMTQGALDDSPQDQAAASRFVKSGHGLLISGPGWGWLVTHHGKSLLADQTANRILIPYGICFEDGTVDPDYSIAGTTSSLLEPDGAIQALTKGGLSIGDNATATLTLQRALAHPSSLESSLTSQVLRLSAAEPGGSVPTPKSPITFSKPFSRLKAWLDAERYAKSSPEDMPVDPSAATFPGPVAEDAPRISKEVTVDTAIPDWHGTGLYAPAGEVVTVSLPGAALHSGLSVRIGAHTDTLWELDKWPRFPAISTSKPLQNGESRVASPFGGLIYIEVPYGCHLGTISVLIRNAVASPFYVAGQTSDEDWKQILATSGAPWAELQGNLVTLVVPIASARKVYSPAALMAYWDEMMQDCYAFFAAPKHPRPERYCPDIEISAGYMHSGYPIMTHIDVADTLCDLFKLRGKSWTWGFYHEMGHNFQQSAWTWDGTGEVTNNLFSLYASEKLNGVTPVTYGDAHPAMAPAAVDARLKKYLAKGARYEDWTSDPFLALSMFAELREGFGWGPFTTLFGQYWKLGPGGHPNTDLDKRDMFMVRFSRIIGRNLGPFFVAWGVPTSDAARRSISDLKPWMPPGWPGK